METNGLENKKINNEQKVNEGFSGQNLPEDYDPSATKLEQELETGKHGNSDIATNRYPNMHPDNRYNRGNIELDE